MTDAGEPYEASDGRTYHYIEKCGRFVEHGFWPSMRRQKVNPDSPIINGVHDMDARSKVPVGPEIVLIGDEEVPRVIVAKHGRNRYACQTCGTWVCDKCGHKRLYANRRYSGIMCCAKKTCWSRKGTWRVGYHTVDRWWDHNDADMVVTGSATAGKGVQLITEEQYAAQQTAESKEGVVSG